ncbi:DNA polymerase I [Roseibacillus ishigakijimensis]|uniref:DNA polymerase I n=1 Tax=Roseibacillus ishigakijimensis TaxID=454146 RepID=A0A934RRN1_9BACT|nr:DNA polymerase I [Roseibacillus ishigakijimensis]MBK1834386.1 DNA polymerase I [Roseibacillus ishigakijimensis]
MTEAPEPNRLFLLDGMALVYRAHFAFIRNPIMNSKGVNTSALFGFTNTLLSIIQTEKPTHLAVAWDTSAPTPRHEKYPAYKANRDEMPEELRAAIPACKELCQAFALPLLEIDGYEADDLIGTLAKTADERGGFHTFMVTPDKDFAQLISPTSTMWRPGRKGGDHEVIREAELPKIWGVNEPHQIIDLLGLMGDASDNIPGVPGVGPKTAVKLIDQFGSIENLLANTAQLKGKQKEKIEENRENALLSKDLATIMRDAPLEVSFEDLALSPYDETAIRELFAEYEFRTLAKRLFGDNASEATSEEAAPEPATSFRTIADTRPDYELVNSPAQEKKLFAALEKADRYCFDLETTSLDRFGCDILGIAFSFQSGSGYYLPYNRVHHPRLQKLFALPAEKIGHNLKFDLHILKSHGIEVAGPFFDTMLVHALLYPEQRHTMDRLAENLLSYQTIKLTELAERALAEKNKAESEEGKKAKTKNSKAKEDSDQMDLFAATNTRGGKKKKPALDMKAIPLEALAEYAAEDADITWQLAELLRPLLQENGLAEVYETVEAPLLPVLVALEAEGITLDPERLAEVDGELSSRIDEVSERITSAAGEPVNLNSPKQLGEVLFDKLKLVDKPKKTRTGQYKTDEQTLSLLAAEHPIAADILLYRQASKLKSTYVDALPGEVAPHDGRIHTHLHQHIAATGRLASSDPNLQNIPIRSELGREIRKAFVPRGDGFTLLAADYSQIELRIMAALSGDPSMIEAFRKDRDIHTETAAKVFGVNSEAVTSEQRRTAKMVNFGIIYGISAFGLSQRLTIPRGEASEIIEAYWKEYPKIREFMDTTIESAKENGYVETLRGRRRYFPDLKSGNGTVRANAERAAINTPIQGTAADMIKLAMIETAQLLGKEGTQSKMLLQVHDELLFDLHESESGTLPAQIVRTMEEALPLPNGVPIKVETGTGATWLEAH